MSQWLKNAYRDGRKKKVVLLRENNPSWKGGQCKKECQKCGKIFMVYPHRKEIAKFCSKKCSNNTTLNGFKKGRKLSEQEKNRMSELMKSRTREKSPNWQGGKSFEPYPLEWTYLLKIAIRQRDRNCCFICRGIGNIVHHIDYNKKNCNPNNLITLCRPCHTKTNYKRSDWLEFFNKYLYA